MVDVAPGPGLVDESLGAKAPVLDGGLQTEDDGALAGLPEGSSEGGASGERAQGQGEDPGSFHRVALQEVAQISRAWV
jgi:hypothetical protein